MRTIRHHLCNHVGAGKFKFYTNDSRTTALDTLHHCSKGVATYFHSTCPGYDSLTPLWTSRIPDRYLAVRTLVDGIPWYFHNVYAPVEDNQRSQFFASLPREFEQGSLHFVGGDFNLAIHPNLDSLNGAQSTSGLQECVDWLCHLRVIDPWRIEHPDLKWLSGPGRKNRLDYIFIDNALFTSLYTTSSFSPNKYHGDHDTLTTTIINRPPGVSLPHRRSWKLPRELLQIPQVAHAIQTEAQALLDELRSDPLCNVGAKWSGWLRRIRLYLKRSQYNRDRSHQIAIDRLKADHLIAKNRQALGQTDSASVAVAEATYSAARDELRQERMDNGFDKHANINERPTSYFFRKPATHKVHITAAKRGDYVTSEPMEVSEIFTSHWSTIMRAPPGQPPPPQHLTDHVLSNLSKRLSPGAHESLEQPLTVEELRLSIVTMQKNKSPGPDGWPVIFFQLAPETFAHILLLVFNYQLTRHGTMLPHQRRSSVSLLYKSGDRADPGNFRPIALMAVEVKILSRALAYRLSHVVDSIVDPSQAGFIRGRFMADHILLIQAMQHLATRTSSQWFATFLDFSKAYDMVRQSFLFLAMERMNIGPNFLGWVRLLYKRPNVHLSINGVLGSAIRSNRGVKQGCPLSCLLFDLYLEPLGDMLRGAPQHGIVALPAEAPTTSVFFADDSTLLSHSLEARDAQLALVDTFCAASGSSLNLSKCITLPLDSNSSTLLRPRHDAIRMAQPGIPIKFLGSFIGIDINQHHQSLSLHESFLKSFSLWSYRARTLQGRNALASSLILSQIWHVTAVSSVPHATLKVWQRVLFKFALGNKSLDSSHFKPLLHTMWLHDKTMGLGIPHIASSIRFQRLRLLQRFMHQGHHRPLWTKLVHDQFRQCLGSLYRESSPFDFLWMKPHSQTRWIDVSELQPLWLEVWGAWHATPLADRLPQPPDLAMDLHAPCWYTTNPRFNQEGHLSIQKLAANVPATARWIRHAASRGLHSLHDIIRVGAGGFWPDYTTFHDTMSSHSPETRVVLVNGNIQIDRVYNSGAIYDRLAFAYNDLRIRHGVRLDIPHDIHSVMPAQHPFRALIKSQLQPFEQWPRYLVKRISFHGTKPSRPHPTSSPDRPDYKSAKQYMRLARDSFKVLTPVHADVWLRVLLRMLPVNDRFPHRLQHDPDSMLCVYRCGAIDTLQHALHGCERIADLWSDHAAAWSTTGATFSWFAITNVDSFQATNVSCQRAKAIYQLWVMLVGVVLSSIWTHHNLVLHQQKQLPPRHALFELTFVLWMATVRRNLRHLDRDDPLHSDMLYVLHNQLLTSRGYRPLSTKHKRCTELRATFDVH